MSNGANRSHDDPLLAELAALLPELAAQGVVELEVTTGQAHLYVRQRLDQRPFRTVAPTASEAEEPVAVEEGLVDITTPLSGVFYASPAPDEPVYVQVGEEVEAGQVVALVEAMKVFNEIHAEVSGVVVAILVTPGQTIQSGQPLIRLRPSAVVAAEA